MKHYRGLFILLLISFAMLTSAKDAYDKEPASVLVVNSFIENSTFPTQIMDAIRDELNQFPPTSYRLVIEKLNPYSIRTTKESQKLAAEFIDRHRYTPPSLLIVIGTPAWVCLREELAHRWKDIPILLVSESDHVATIEQYLRQNPPDDLEKTPLYQSVLGYNITVVRKPLFIRETIDLMKRLKPEMKKVYLISDGRYTSIQMRAELQRNVERYHPNLTTGFLTEGEISLEDVCDLIRKNDHRAGYLYYSWTQNSTREQGETAMNVYKLLATVNEQPIFSLEDIGLDDGSLAGGYFGSNNMLSTTVVEMMREIVYKGRKASDVPWRMSNDIGYHLNLPVLLNAGIPQTRIPSTAHLLFAPPSFWKAHWLTIMMVVGCAVLMLLCLLYILHLRHVNRQQQLEIITLDKYKNMEYAQQLSAKSEKVKNAFLSGISQEIRKPLNAIVGFSSMLMGANSESEKQEYMKLIEQNNAVLLKTVDDLLFLSETDSLTCESAPFELYDLFKDMEHTAKLRLHAANKQKKVHVRLDKIASCHIISDYKQLSNVMDLLLNNAIKCTTKGTIRFGYRREQSNIYMYVKDTGCGISPEDMQAIFQCFNKIDTSSHGIDVSLAICKHIVEKLGGTIGIDSEEGVGATFWINIPITQG